MIEYLEVQYKMYMKYLNKLILLLMLTKEIYHEIIKLLEDHKEVNLTVEVTIIIKWEDPI